MQQQLCYVLGLYLNPQPRACGLLGVWEVIQLRQSWPELGQKDSLGNLLCLPASKVKQNTVFSELVAFSCCQ